VGEGNNVLASRMQNTEKKTAFGVKGRRKSKGPHDFKGPSHIRPETQGADRAGNFGLSKGGTGRGGEKEKREKTASVGLGTRKKGKALCVGGVGGCGGVLWGWGVGWGVGDVPSARQLKDSHINGKKKGGAFLNGETCLENGKVQVWREGHKKNTKLEGPRGKPVRPAMQKKSPKGKRKKPCGFGGGRKGGQNNEGQKKKKNKS